MRMLDLFCGRFGWGRAFAERGWDVVGIDLTPQEPPSKCAFVQGDVFDISLVFVRGFDFVCASSPCEEFSIHGMKHFHPTPKYPDVGIKLFNHTRSLLEASGVPYVMENVRPAQQFVGRAVHHCGPFYLWGPGVPILMPQGVTKGIDVGSSKAVKGMSLEEKRIYRKQFPWNQAWSSSKTRQRDTAKAATIPPILAAAVAAHAEEMLRD